MKHKAHDTSNPQLWVACTSPLKGEQAEDAASKLGAPQLSFDELESVRGNRCVLMFATGEIYLDVHWDKQHMQIKVDFAEGKSAYRRLHGGGRGQFIAKAVGLNKNFSPTVLDCTAGTGEDAFVLASLGCPLTMLERCLLPTLLVQDGLDRAHTYADENDDAELLEIINRMHLHHIASLEYLSSTTEAFDVVYLDPMFPERKKSAAVKKEMQVFQQFLGADEDAGELLEPALDNAVYRVVVKRPSSAPHLANRAPSYEIKGKSTRFDIYTKKAIPSG